MDLDNLISYFIYEYLGEERCQRAETIRTVRANADKDTCLWQEPIVRHVVMHVYERGISQD